jgi:hypothetical protein
MVLKFHQTILEIGFEVSPLDHYVYICNENDKFTILSLYIDNILLTGNNPDMIKKTKLLLSSKFEMKDMGVATCVLGIKMTKNRNLKLLYLDQENYLEKILKRFNMDKCKHLNTPISKCQYLSKSMCSQNEKEIQEMKSIPYAQVMGSLMYAMTSTRLDICCSAPTLLNERRKWKSPIAIKHYYLILDIIRDYKSSSGIFFFFIYNPHQTHQS